VQCGAVCECVAVCRSVVQSGAVCCSSDGACGGSTKGWHQIRLYRVAKTHRMP